MAAPGPTAGLGQKKGKGGGRLVRGWPNAAEVL